MWLPEFTTAYLCYHHWSIGIAGPHKSIPSIHNSCKLSFLIFIANTVTWYALVIGRISNAERIHNAEN